MLEKAELHREEAVEEIKKIIQPYKMESRVQKANKIFLKMTRQRIPLSKVYDIIGVRAITKDVEECYSLFETVIKVYTLFYKAHDYIAFPKKNNYSSIDLNISVKKQPVQLQIRTEEMNERAANGSAEHEQWDNERMQWFKKHLEKHPEEYRCYIDKALKKICNAYPATIGQDLTLRDYLTILSTKAFNPNAKLKRIPGSRVEDILKREGCI